MKRNVNIEHPTSNVQLSTRRREDAETQEVHQRSRATNGMAICGAMPAPGETISTTRVCRFVTCPECIAKWEEIVEATFAPL